MTKRLVAKKAHSASVKNHRVHLMKRVSSMVEEITIQGYSLAQKQKRLVTYYMCECSEEDIIYRQLNIPERSLSEYTKLVVKK